MSLGVVRSFFSSLRFRLVALVILASVPAFGLIIWNNLEQRADKRDAAKVLAQEVTEATAAQEAQVLQSARELLSQLTAAPQVTGGDIAACEEYLAGVLAIEPRYAGFGVTNLDGDIYCSGTDAHPNVADRAYFQRVIASGEFAVGDYVIARDGAETPVLSFASPIFDERGQLAGMVATGVNLDWLNEFSARLTLPEGATLTVIDGNGVVLARQPDPEGYVGKAVPEAPLLEHVLAEGKGTAEAPGLDGVERLYAFAPMGGGSGAFVAFGVPASTAYAGIDRTLYRNLALLAVVTLLALIAAWLGGDWFVLRGVRALVGAAHRVAGGDLRARTGLAHHAGEVGQLAGAFDEMAGALEQREAERNRAEEQLKRSIEDLARSNAELEQYAYAASHDLQEPLRMVASFTKLLEIRYQGKLDAEADEYIAFAAEGASRMHMMIQELLTYSRVGSRGKEPAPVEMETVLERALAGLTPAVTAAGAAVTHDRLPAVQGDDEQLYLLFRNLIDNALKFRGEKPPRIHISAREDGGGWLFLIRDDGIGIDAQYADRAFVLFQRLQARERYPGTGAGLALCKKIVERHGGRIWVESAIGAGATFYFTLPAANRRAA